MDYAAIPTGKLQQALAAALIKHELAQGSPEAAAHLEAIQNEIATRQV